MDTVERLPDSHCLSAELRRPTESLKRTSVGVRVLPEGGEGERVAALRIGSSCSCMVAAGGAEEINQQSHILLLPPQWTSFCSEVQRSNQAEEGQGSEERLLTAAAPGISSPRWL